MKTKNTKPNSAFILAAGLGKRLRPYTDSLPKPLVPVAGRPILDYTIEKLRLDNIENVTINLNYFGEKIEQHFSNCQNPQITFSKEDELLDTGGGVKKALQTMQGDAFYIINGDALWTDGVSGTALNQLAEVWDPEKMDILLLLQPIDNMSLTKGIGDYEVNEDGRAIRSQTKTGQYMFGGIRITKKSVFDDTPEGEAFSYLKLMDRAEEEGKLYALIHDGEWHHISTPNDLERVNEAMANNTPEKQEVKTA